MNLKNYFDQGVSFESYLKSVEDFVENKKEDDFWNYYSLNLNRMNRWLKTIEISSEMKQKLHTITKKLNIIVITEGWCGDAAQIIPWVHKLVAQLPNAQEKYVYRDSHLDLMDAYLTNGARSIPIFVVVDEETGHELFHWGPRPEWGTKLLQKMKSGEISKEEFQLEIQKSYNKDKGKSILEEWLNLLK